MFKKKENHILLITIILVAVGLFTLFSASLTYLQNPESFYKIISFQIFAILAGFFGIFIILKNKKINYSTIRKNSIWLFVFAFIMQFLVLIPSFSITKNGASRWIDLGIVIQPSEFFRFAAILFVAHLFYIFKKELIKIKPFIIFFILPMIFLSIFYYFIKDFGSLMVLSISISAMLLFSENAKKKFLVLGLLLMLLLGVAFISGHGERRLKTFYNSIFQPELMDTSNEYYQNYNMIKAVGSGQLWGVGYGGSVQKFNHNLSESISDSIFSIFAEEFGFVFSVILILIYTALGLKIFINLTKIQNYYEQMVVAGLATNILFPAFYNMWTVVGIAPLSGIPLTFISKGGTSIFFSLLSVGIILLFFQKK